MDSQQPIKGDDLPFYTDFYRNVPDGFRLSNLTLHTDTPLTTAVWPVLYPQLERYFRNFEIVGKTYADFFEFLKTALDTGADTLERHLEVYQSDICKPILGRTEKITYNDNVATSGESQEIGVPADATDSDKPDSKSKSNNTNSHTGTVQTDLSDLGVRPNYETINGFLDANRTILMTAVNIFKGCFIQMEVWY